jgi:two-component system sensor histidine kinase KdpD
MARELSAALTTERIGEIADRYIRENFNARARLLLPDERPAGPDVEDPGAQPPGGARTGPTAGALRLSLRAPMRVRGVLSVEPDEGALAPDADQRRLLETFAALIAISLERVHYISVAREAEVETASERLRNSLLGALSHDLRTPLTAMVGLADALSLADPPLGPEQAELAHAIRDEALRTSALVNNLLDMARLQSGPVRLRREWQPLEDVVGAALQASARQLAGHRLRLDLPLDLPLVNVDAVLMERALCNLFENAAKYTPPGSAIGIVARPLDDWIEVVVADDGPGLPPGREHELFAKFTRGRSESTIPGVGLGLAIVQAIVEAHGGRVRAENREGGGSRFVLELPRGEPPELPDRDA